MKIENHKSILIPRLIAKSLLLIILVNFLFILLKDFPYGHLSLYNFIFPGRERLPFGETPSESYNLTMSNLDAMVSSHIISAYRESEDYHIILIGDSSIWGVLQKPENTLSGLLNNKIDFPCESKNIKVFNLGYPSLSVLKDLFILEKIKAYKPDLVIWNITLESLLYQEQLGTPLVKNNPLILNTTIEDYKIPYQKEKINPLDFTLFNQRRNLADILRLQFFGSLWAGSGIDQDYPLKYNPAQRDFDLDDSYKKFVSKKITREDLVLDIVLNAVKALPETKFILINEPILISTGKNSDLRYNFYYPRWAYDQYRVIAKNYFEQNKINYFDLWNFIPESEFTNSAIHLTQYGENILADEIMHLIKNHCERIGKDK